MRGSRHGMVRYGKGCIVLRRETRIYNDGQWMDKWVVVGQVRSGQVGMEAR